MSTSRVHQKVVILCPGHTIDFRSHLQWIAKSVRGVDDLERGGFVSKNTTTARFGTRSFLPC